MGELLGQLLEDVAPPSMLLAAAAARKALSQEETDVRPCWADPELNNKMLSADRRRQSAEPRPDRCCMDIGMDLDNGGSIPNDQIEQKLTINE
jgi:hypothetical protein